MNPAPFLIVETGRPVPPLRRYGRFHTGFASPPDWKNTRRWWSMSNTVMLCPIRMPCWRAGDRLAAFVTDHADWSERSAAWLRQTAHAGLPVFGICYGHQLLAHALGGEVAYNPAGRESGTIELELQPQAAQDPLFQGLPQHFAAHATHLQTVLRAPEGAQVLARSPLDGCHAFRWGRQAWGCSSIRNSPPPHARLRACPRRLHRSPRRLRPHHRARSQRRAAGPPAVAPFRAPGAAVFSPADGKTGIIGGTGSRPAPPVPPGCP